MRASSPGYEGLAPQKGKKTPHGLIGVLAMRMRDFFHKVEVKF